MDKRVIFSSFLIKEKEYTIPVERNNKDSEFYKSFFNKYSKCYTNSDKYIEFIMNLEAMDKEDYKKWYTAFVTTDTKIISNNIEFVNKISKDPNNYTIFKNMKNIYSSYLGLINRSVPVSVNSTILNKKDEVEKEISSFFANISDSTTIASNAASSIISELLTRYEEELKEPVLKEYVIDLLYDVEKRILKAAKESLEKIQIVEKSINGTQMSGIIANDNWKRHKERNIGTFVGKNIH